MSTTYGLGDLEGDGIGAEIVPSAVEVATFAARAAGDSVDWVTPPLGTTAIGTHGTPVPGETRRTLAGLDGWYLGPHDSVAFPVPRPSARAPTSSSSGRTPRASAPTATPSPAPASSCPTPDTEIMMGIVTRQATDGSPGGLRPRALAPREADRRPQGERPQADHRPVPYGVAGSYP